MRTHTRTLAALALLTGLWLGELPAASAAAPPTRPLRPYPQSAPATEPAPDPLRTLSLPFPFRSTQRWTIRTVVPGHVAVFGGRLIYVPPRYTLVPSGSAKR